VGCREGLSPLMLYRNEGLASSQGCSMRVCHLTAVGCAGSAAVPGGHHCPLSSGGDPTPSLTLSDSPPGGCQASVESVVLSALAGSGGDGQGLPVVFRQSRAVTISVSILRGSSVLGLWQEIAGLLKGI
jgi:hypothetical protein